MKYILIILLTLISIKTYALELTLSQGTVKPTPIAVTDLFSNNSSLEKIGKNISSVISDNLEIACGNNQTIRILEIQREGKNSQKISEFMLGSKIKKGSKIPNV